MIGRHAIRNPWIFRQIEDVIVKDKVQDLDAIADLKARAADKPQQEMFA